MKWSEISMITRISIVLVIGLSMVSLFAQDNLPLTSAVQYEVRADSLLRSNQPQDVTLLLTCNSTAGLDAYEIKIYDLKVMWTLVSANLNGEPLWLVSADTRTGKENVLAWEYDAEQALLRLYPNEWAGRNQLEVTVRASILQPALLKKTDSKVIALEADMGGQKFQCETTGSGGDMTFKKNIRKTQ
jgi:hypothetical protein